MSEWFDEHGFIGGIIIIGIIILFTWLATGETPGDQDYSTPDTTEYIDASPARN